MDINQKVKISIQDRSVWDMGAADSMDGATGTIETIKGDKALVNFNHPIKCWKSYQLPVTGFWFDKTDLISI